MEKVDFNKLQKESLHAFLEHNKDKITNELVIKQLDLHSMLISTMLSHYHKEIAHQQDAD